MSLILNDQLETAYFFPIPPKRLQLWPEAGPVSVPKALLCLEHVDEARVSPELIVGPWTFESMTRYTPYDTPKAMP